MTDTEMTDQNIAVALGIWMKEARELTDWVLGRYGIKPEAVSISWEWKLTASAGRCTTYGIHLPPEERTADIRLSPNIWFRGDAKTRRQTIIHEACHAVARIKHGWHRNKPDAAPHGWYWQQTMRDCGVEPTRCHKVDVSDLKKHRRKAQRWPYTCKHKCYTYRLTKIRIRRMKEGKKYRCSYCGGELYEVVEDVAQRSEGDE
jgi:predicted SprT family Zn-dependent metalloprotease